MNDATPTTTPLPSVTECFFKAWQLYRERWQTALLILIVPVIVIFLIDLFGPSQSIDTLSDLLNTTTVGAIFGVISWAVAIISQATIFLLVHAKPGELTAGKAYQQILPKMLSVWWIGLLVTAAIVLGFIVFIIPGIYLMIALAFSMPILLFENQIGYQALKRGRALVKGRWFEVFIRLLIFGVLSLIVSAIITSPVTFGVGGSTMAFILQSVVTLLWTPFSIAFTYTIYKQLVATKKG